MSVTTRAGATAMEDVAAAPLQQPTQGSSRFLDLPAELRNRIYDLVATDNGPLRRSRQRQGLLVVNKQVRLEYLSIYYSPPHITIEWWDIGIWRRLTEWKVIKELVDGHSRWGQHRSERVMSSPDLDTTKRAVEKCEWQPDHSFYVVVKNEIKQEVKKRDKKGMKTTVIKKWIGWEVFCVPAPWGEGRPIQSSPAKPKMILQEATGCQPM